MENTFISHELDEMRSQINALKEKLEKQTIVNTITPIEALNLLFELKKKADGR